MSMFTTVRTVSLSILFLVNLLLVGFASAAAKDCVHTFGNVPSSLVLCVAGSALILLFVPAALSGLWFRNAFLSQVWFESCWVFLFAIVQFSTALILTTRDWSCEDPLLEPSQSAQSPACVRYESALALSWISALTILAIAVLTTAMIYAHAWNDPDMWFADMNDMSFGRSSSTPPAEKLKPKIGNPIRVHSDNLWYDVDLESGSGHGSGQSEPRSHFSMSTTAGASRRASFWSIPQWARTKSGKRGVAPAFPTGRGRPPVPPLRRPTKTPIYDHYANREKSLPPTPIVERPTNPEPVTPSVASAPLSVQKLTVSRLMREMERDEVNLHRAVAAAFLEGNVSPQSSGHSWATHSPVQPAKAPRVPQLHFSAASDGDPLPAPRNGMSWLGRPWRDTVQQPNSLATSYDAPSIYSQPSLASMPKAFLR